MAEDEHNLSRESGELRIDRLAAVVGLAALMCLFLNSCSTQEQHSPRAKRRYLSDDPKSAYWLLEQFQKQEYSNYPTAFRVTETSEEIAILRRFSRTFGMSPNEEIRTSPLFSDFEKNMHSRISLPMPTRYENPISYWMTTLAAERVTNAAAKLGLYLTHPLRFATIPTKRVDAEARVLGVAEGSGPVIIVNQWTYLATLFMLQSVCHALELSFEGRDEMPLSDITAERIRDIIVRRPEAQIHFLRALRLCWTKEGSLQRPGSPVELRLTRAASNAIGDGMHFFVVAHEFAHIIRDHKPAGKSTLMVSTVKGNATMSIEEVARSYYQEIQADVLATSLLGQQFASEATMIAFDLLSGRNPDNTDIRVFAGICTLSSPLFFFKCAEILQELEFMREYGETPKPRNDDITKEAELLKLSLLTGGTNQVVIDQWAGDTNSSNEFASHPSPSLRGAVAMRTIEELLEKMGPTSRRDLSIYLDAALAFTTGLDVLWEKVKPAMLSSPSFLRD